MRKIKDMRVLGHLKIGVVGKKTDEEMKKYRIIPDFYPKEYTVEKLAAESVKLYRRRRKCTVYSIQYFSCK